MFTKSRLLSILLLFVTLGVILYTFQPSSSKFLKQNNNLEGKIGHNEHHCDHEEWISKYNIEYPKELQDSPIEATLNHELKLRKEHKASNWQQIRILSDYSNLKNVVDTQANFITQQLMPSAVAFIKNALEVYPKISINEVIGLNQCIDLPVNPKHNRLGVPNHDLVLYVGATNAQNQGWLARAGPCAFDQTTGRPVAGMVLFNLAFISKLNFNDASDTTWYKWVTTTIHELTHVLAFSPTLYPIYINPNTNKKLGIQNVITEAYGRKWIILPNIVSLVKSYFNCPNAWGAPLEDNGDAGSAGAHWERVSFGNEAMTASEFPDSSFSQFTFQLYQETGWYLVNKSATQPFYWGNFEGCAIAQGKCTQGASEFCSAANARGCSIDYFGLGYCSFGQDPFSNSCAYWKEYSDGDCRTKSDFTTGIAKSIGGTVGADSRCWTTSLARAVGFKNIDYGCFKSQCSQDRKSISVKVGTQHYTCTQSGQVINVTANGSSGTITCPDITRFCAYENVCPGQCSGRGTCTGQTCKCWQGYSGVDCSISTS